MKPKKNLEEEITILNDMIDALVELLEEKRVITTQEWEDKIKKKLK